MIKTYIKIAWRNITKDRFYSAMNIIGLSAGIAFALLIAAYVYGEFRVNRDLKNANNQYIIQSKWKDPNRGFDLTTLGSLPKALKEHYPKLIANYFRWDGITSNVSEGNKHFSEVMLICDNTLLDMYGFSLLYGDKKTAFQDPFSVVITESKARKYFGKTDVVGQTLTIESFSGTKHGFMISGVMKTPYRNSVTDITDENSEFYIPIASAKYFGRNIESWDNQYIAGYVELQKGISPKDLSDPIKHLIALNTNKQTSENLKPYLSPMRDYYLDSNNGTIRKMLYTLSFAALFILIMAIINFVNICISRASTRMKEIGIRKVLGGLKKQLIIQFLIESVLLVAMATLFSLVLYQFARPFFSNILTKEILSLTQFPLYFILAPFLLAFTVGIISGIYPAFILSSLKSVDSLKGKLKTVNEKIWLRKSLLGFQFAIATIVIISAFIVSKQIDLFFSKSIGYDKDYVVTARVPRDWSKKGVEHMEAIRDEFRRLSSVNDVSLSYEIPNGNNGGQTNIYKAGQDSTKALALQSFIVDERFATTYKIPMAAGQFFNASSEGYDSTHVVINEAAAKAFHWSADQAVGNTLRFPGDPSEFIVAGVIKDFHFGSMQQNIEPGWYGNVKRAVTYRFLSFRVSPGSLNKSIAAIQEKWTELMPDAPFEYTFMDDNLKKLYKTEIQLQKASYVATTLVLIIAWLGILGLISLSIQKRTKEIGIRKILGSPVKDIIALFMKEFLVIIVIAGLVACPLTYLIMRKWLDEYTYRIDITAYPFITSIGLLVVATGILISFQTVRAALVNPVKSLRAE